MTIGANSEQSQTGRAGGSKDVISGRFQLTDVFAEEMNGRRSHFCTKWLDLWFVGCGVWGEEWMVMLL